MLLSVTNRKLSEIPYKDLIIIKITFDDIKLEDQKEVVLHVEGKYLNDYTLLKFLEHVKKCVESKCNRDRFSDEESLVAMYSESVEDMRDFTKFTGERVSLATYLYKGLKEGDYEYDLEYVALDCCAKLYYEIPKDDLEFYFRYSSLDVSYIGNDGFEKVVDIIS